MRHLPKIVVVLEIARVDGLQARMVERELCQPAPPRDHFGRRLGAQIAVAHHAEASRRGLSHRADAGQSGETTHEIVAALGFDFNGKSAAEHLPTEITDRTHQCDAAGVEQRDAVANTLHTVEQMRRQ
jgi:hypothetical protein